MTRELIESAKRAGLLVRERVPIARGVTLLIGPPASAVSCVALDIVRCRCAKPIRHTGACYYRKLRKRARFEYFREVAGAVRESAKDFGADAGLTNAALILVAGIWTRKKLELLELVRCDATTIANVTRRCVRSRLWSENGVVLAEFTKENGYDLEFWMNAMVAAGQLNVEWRGKEPWYSAAQSPTVGQKGLQQ